MRLWWAVTALILISFHRGHAAADPSTVLILVNDLVPPESGTNGIGASIYVGQYYAARRGIPAANILHLNVPLGCCANDPHDWDSWNIPWSNFETYIRAPLRNFLESGGLKYGIKYIVPTYGVAVRVTTPNHPAGLQPDFLSIDSFLAALYSGTDAQFQRNPYAVSVPSYSKPHFADWQNPQRWPMYLVSRLDGPSAAIAAGLVDKAILAESTLSRSDGIGYFDYQNSSNYPVTDGTMYNAYQLALQHGMRAVLNDQSVTGAMIHDAPQALWAWGWYSGPFDWDGYQFVNGAVGAQLTSYTANVIRYQGQGTWVARWLQAGVTATWGTTGEPYTSGYANGDNLLDHFWNGYNFGESSYLAAPVLNWMMVFVGDPLYAPRIFETPPSPPDATPVLTFAARRDGLTYSGTLTLSAAVSPNTVAVQFQADGYDAGPELHAPPYTASFDTTPADNGPILLTAKVRDSSGATLISDPVPIILFNEASSNAPVISGVSVVSVAARSAVLTWSTDINSDSQVEYGLDSRYGSSSPVDGTFAMSHQVTLADLTPATLYHFRVKSRNQAGQAGVSGDFTFTTAPEYTISVTPASGTTETQAFQFTFAGVSAVASLNMAINSTLSGANACYLIYEGWSGNVALVNDAGTELFEARPGDPGTLANGQCSISVPSVSVSSSGDMITVRATVEFSPAFAGPKTVWGNWYSYGVGIVGPWIVLGSWSVPGA
jgi:uncharacterized protein (TIGR03790 family)